MRSSKKLYWNILATAFFLTLTIFSSGSLLAQVEKTQEEVTVTAVEVPVRVLYQGQSVKDLTKEDFTIYENGIKQKITSFEAVSRKIAATRVLSQPENKMRPSKRLFMLIFNIIDYNQAVGEAIDYFFQHIFRPGDHFLVLTENRLIKIQKGKNKPDVILTIKEALKKYKILSAQNTLKAFRELRFEGDRLLATLRGQSQFVPLDQAMIRFFDNYQRAWLNYRRQYLTPELSSYRSIIRRVRQIEGEKWAICFQQRELFPKLKNASRLDIAINNWIESQADPMNQIKARLVQAKRMELQRSLDVSEFFPAESLKELFMEANITFHMILLKSFRTVFSQDFELQEVAEDYEDCFKKISQVTGGSTSFSNNPTEALMKATEKEDYYYLLVYSPHEDIEPKERKIEVKVNRSGLKVISLKHLPERPEPFITIADFKVNRKTVKFSLLNYKMSKIKGKKTGIADVKITLFDENSKKVFDQGKNLNSTKKETHISLNFNWLKSGNYFIIIQAMDKIANESDVLSSYIKL